MKLSNKIISNIKSNWLIYTIGILFIAFIFRFRDEIITIFATFKTGLLGWLLLAAITQVFSYLFVTLAYRNAFDVVGLKRRFNELVPLVLSVLVVNITTPTAGIASTILFANDARTRKQSPTKAAAVVFLVMLAESIGFSVFLIFAITYLAFYRDLGATELLSTLMFLILNLFIVFLFTAALTESKLLLSFLMKVETFINKFRRHKLKNWATTVNDELIEISKSIVKRPWDFLQTIAFEFLANTANIVCLLFIFMAFQLNLKFGMIITGYAISYLFRIISPSPEGIGFTEGAMVLIFTTFGLPIIGATAISLMFRLFNFWIPLAFGFYFFNKKHYKINEE